MLLSYLTEQLLGHTPDIAIWFIAIWALRSRTRTGIVTGAIVGTLGLLAHIGMWLGPNPPSGEEAVWLFVSLIAGSAAGWFFSSRRNWKKSTIAVSGQESE